MKQLLDGLVPVYSHSKVVIMNTRLFLDLYIYLVNPKAQISFACIFVGHAVQAEFAGCHGITVLSLIFQWLSAIGGIPL